jgi:hypothetical protein
MKLSTTGWVWVGDALQYLLFLLAVFVVIAAFTHEWT